MIRAVNISSYTLFFLLLRPYNTALVSNPLTLKGYDKVKIVLTNLEMEDIVYWAL